MPRIPLFAGAALTWLFLAVSPAAAQERDISAGNHWLQQCTSADDLLCLVFIMGLHDGITVGALAGSGDLNRQMYCVDGVNNGQRKDVFVKYLRAHPETRHEIASVLFYQAMREAFPCAKR